MSKGSKAAPAPQQTAASSTLPDWLSNAGESVINRATDLSNQPYNPYTGEGVAPLTADQNQSYSAVEGMQGKYDPAYQGAMGAYQGLLGSAAPITAGGVTDNTNSLYGNYQQQVMNPAQSLLGQYAAQGPATNQGIAGNASSNAQQFMSPYSSMVIDPALRAGQQQLALANQGIAGQANNVGAFGGSRQGVAEGNAAAQTSLGTQQYIGNMLNTGWNNALTAGGNIALQQGLQAGQQGLSASNALAQLGATGYQNAQTEGADISNRNLAAGLTAAAGLPNVAGAYQASDAKNAGLLNAAGNEQQQYAQTVDDYNRGMFYQQQDDPLTKLGILQNSTMGIPYNTYSNATYAPAAGASKNMLGAAAGGALSGAGTGAAIGSVVPGIGTAIGAGIGFVGGGLLGALSN